MNEKLILKNIFYILCAIVILLSCDSKKQQEMKKFPVEKRLKAHKIPFNVIIDRRSSIVIDDCLIYVSSPKADTLVHVFSLPEITPVKKFGFTGQGPDDFQSPSIIKNNTNRLYLDGNNPPQLLKSFDFQNREDTLVAEEMKFYLEDIPIWNTRNLHVINDSILFYFENIPSQMFLKSYHLKSKLQLHSKKIKSIEKEELQLAEINNGFLLVNNRTVAYAYLYKDRIDFMELDFHDKRVVQEDDKTKTHIDYRDVNNSSIYYLSGYAGKEKFYFLYLGCSINNMKNTNKEKAIEVFDSEGNALARYILDISPSDFTVDEKHNRIYAWGEDEDLVLVYDMEDAK